ncbi:hypothetical protein BGZ47_000070 [Haplosporangium gracile]|nr:hypothetical protein BGZ47_000070 [Haplosporangium gracile]
MNMTGTYGYCYIPPVQELNRSFGIQDRVTNGTRTHVAGATVIVERPFWTWDWNLPNLTALHLSSEFAYRFEFRMLQRCPSLEALTLNILMRNVTHTRTLLEADLVTPVPASHFDSPAHFMMSSVEKVEIVCPNVRSLNMYGSWKIDKELLPKFLLGLFPNLEHFSEYGWKDFALDCLVKVVRHLPNKIKALQLNQSCSDKDKMIEMGAFPKSQVDKPRFKGKAVLPLTVRFKGEQFAFLKDEREYYD